MNTEDHRQPEALPSGPFQHCDGCSPEFTCWNTGAVCRHPECIKHAPPPSHPYPVPSAPSPEVQALVAFPVLAGHCHPDEIVVLKSQFDAAKELSDRQSGEVEALKAETPRTKFAEPDELLTEMINEHHRASGTPSNFIAMRAALAVVEGELKLWSWACRFRDDENDTLRAQLAADKEYWITRERQLLDKLQAERLHADSEIARLKEEIARLTKP